MTDDRAGSYAFGSFHENDRELKRLKNQAAAAQALERGILESCGLQPGMDVLDLACGPGVVSCLLARMVGEGTVLGVDLNADLLQEAKAAAGREGLGNLSFEQGDVYDLTFEDASFDFVYARFLFQHLQHPERALAQARRVLRPGGILAIADVDDDWLTLYPEPSCFRDFVDRAAAEQAKRGGDRYIGRKLGGLLSQCGFEEVRARVTTVGRDEIGLKGLLDLTTGFKYQQLAAIDADLALKQKEEIYAILDNPNAWGYVGVFVANGRR